MVIMIYRIMELCEPEVLPCDLFDGRAVVPVYIILYN